MINLIKEHWVLILMITGIILIIMFVIKYGGSMGSLLISSLRTFNLTTDQIINAAWMLGAYLLLLWAFAYMWPELWAAWKGEGFWLSQLLFLSAIGFLAGFWISNDRVRLIAIPLLIFAVMVAIHTIKSNSLDSGTANTNTPPPIAPIVKANPHQPVGPYDIGPFELLPGDCLEIAVYHGWSCYTDDVPNLVKTYIQEKRKLANGNIVALGGKLYNKSKDRMVIDPKWKRYP